MIRIINNINVLSIQQFINYFNKMPWLDYENYNTVIINNSIMVQVTELGYELGDLIGYFINSNNEKVQTLRICAKDIKSLHTAVVDNTSYQWVAD